MVCFEVGHYEEAGRLYDELFLCSSKLLGDDHPRTLEIMHGLSCTVYKLGQRRSALNILRECAEKLERKLGPHHPHTVKRHKLMRDWEAKEQLREIAGEQDKTSTNDESDVV
jgi:hypothetical protein